MKFGRKIFEIPSPKIRFFTIPLNAAKSLSRLRLRNIFPVLKIDKALHLSMKRPVGIFGARNARGFFSIPQILILRNLGFCKTV
ncbi:MAG: hypothetical protein DBX55_07300 [Verrucomicrobia bacterium]|nr:MAG: hypothetical protein DBX55_07300 [Verrucomicrobiota bacterium]